MPAARQVDTVQKAVETPHDGSSEAVPESSHTSVGEPAERWARFKTLVSEASKPSGVMRQALDVREVGIDQGVLRILLGPKTKLFRTSSTEAGRSFVRPRSLCSRSSDARRILNWRQETVTGFCGRHAELSRRIRSRIAARSYELESHITK